MSVHQETGTILSNKEIAYNHFKLTITAPKISQSAQTAQFVNIKVSCTTDPLLRRPFSIYETNCSHPTNTVSSKRSNTTSIPSTISIIYKVIGRGTQLLSTFKAGHELNLLGPLGNGFEIPDPSAKTAFIAGGVGIASLNSFTKKMTNGFDLFYGVKTKTEILELDHWQTLADTLHITTDDGSFGQKGMITSLFQPQSDHYEQVVCCGPEAMMKAIHKLCSKSCHSYFILEETMACGLGLCMGCVTKTKAGYQRICKDGPVFKGSDLIWSNNH
ncbi:dihydroorotate dehydrogenase electron transfer subunit [Thermoproteota archaeon]